MITSQTVAPAWVVDAGTMPTLAFGVGLGLRVLLAPFEVGVEGALFPVRRTDLASDAEAHVEFHGWDAGLAGCWLPVGSTVSFGLCAGAALRSLSGASFDVLDEAQAQQWMVSLQAGGVARIALAPWLSLRQDLRASVLLGRASWRVRDFDFRHEPALLGWRYALGLEVIR